MPLFSRLCERLVFGEQFDPAHVSFGSTALRSASPLSGGTRRKLSPATVGFRVGWHPRMRSHDGRSWFFGKEGLRVGTRSAQSIKGKVKVNDSVKTTRRQLAELRRAEVKAKKPEARAKQIERQLSKGRRRANDDEELSRHQAKMISLRSSKPPGRRSTPRL